MKKFFNGIFADNPTKLGFTVSLIITILSAIVVLVNYSRLPPYLPLYNQLTWGEQRLGTNVEIFIPIIVVSFIFLLNLIIAPFFYEKIPLISRVLAVVSLISSVLVLIFLIRTIVVVI